MNPKTFLFIGRSGAGKGTQAKLLISHLTSEQEDCLPVYYLETGEHFREFIKGTSFSSRSSKALYDKAERQPDFLAIWNWADLLVKNFTDSMHLIMDGMPRSITEAQILRTALDFYGIKNPHIIYIDVSPEWSFTRLKERHRADDKSDDEINRKISWFNQDVLPAIEYFKNDPYYHFIDVNGEQSVEKVQEDIINAITMGTIV